MAYTVYLESEFAYWKSSSTLSVIAHLVKQNVKTRICIIMSQKLFPHATLSRSRCNLMGNNNNANFAFIYFYCICTFNNRVGGSPKLAAQNALESFPWVAKIQVLEPLSVYLPGWPLAGSWVRNSMQDLTKATKALGCGIQPSQPGTTAEPNTNPSDTKFY